MTAPPLEGNRMTLKNVISKSNSYQVGIAQMLVARSMAHFHHSILRSYNLSPVEWFVLGTVYDKKKGIRITDLAKIFDVKTTYITAIVNSLRRNGYVETKTDASDARVRLVVATAKGTHDVPRIESRLKSEAELLFKDRVTPEQLEGYFQVVRSLGIS
jgi:DNA-binding MarR family transcriptional regulator